MSVTDLTSPAPGPATAAAPGKAGAASTWVRVFLVCGLLLGSAALRSWQDRCIRAELKEGLRLPRFDLTTIPLTLGDWKGEATKIDPQIAKATGAEQIVTRRYVNGNTGVSVDVILLYGPAVDMYIHVPEVCYPAAGYASMGDPAVREIIAGPYKALFRSVVYGKGEGAAAELQEVYYSWWRNGVWSPDLGQQKQYERIPSMYKVHVSRLVTDRERRDVGNPCESIIRELLPQMERRIATSSAMPAPTSTPASTPTSPPAPGPASTPTPTS